jgi:deoxyribonucleoside regulator
LLQRAREQGIVHIEIRDPSASGTELESMLREKYSLKKVIVVPEDSRETIIKQRLGQAAVRYLETLLQDNMVLGVSWGTTMQEVARQLNPKSIKNMSIVQLNGGVSKASYETHASETAQIIGEKLQAVPYLLPLPAIVDSKELKTAITLDKNIGRTLNLGRKATLALYTIGLFDRESVLVKADYFEESEIYSLIESGAVGDICSRIIDTEGNICSTALDARTIGIELGELKKKSYTIAVAGGKDKYPAIRAALKGHWFNCLIIDEWVAGELSQE